MSIQLVPGTSYVPAVEVGLQRFSRLYPELFANFTYTQIFIRDVELNTTCGVGGRQAVVDHLTRLYVDGELQKPNTILIAPFHGAVFVAAMRHFGWKTAVIISGFGSMNRTDSGKVLTMTSGVVAELTRVIPEINFLALNTDPKKGGWHTALREAQTYSRTAGELGMSDGNYVRKSDAYSG
ncbi:hypothetical protein RvY_06517 [Ramazzottius varieornatus]|uniref:Uncharacterized protein n=1 Tax=Ramazzottius varieornatus TaxID=947166 RepID=A0A1D1V2B1_RAMVA|nr:hypothetical protein RvY_06517 [Ramazzottius varieornatus]